MDKNRTDGDRAADFGLDTMKWIGDQAQSRIDRLNRAVDDAKLRADALGGRTYGSHFEIFGQQRQQVAEELQKNPPNKLATAVKLATILVSGALLVYKAVRR